MSDQSTEIIKLKIKLILEKIDRLFAESAGRSKQFRSDTAPYRRVKEVEAMLKDLINDKN